MRGREREGAGSDGLSSEARFELLSSALAEESFSVEFRGQPKQATKQSKVRPDATAQVNVVTNIKISVGRNTRMCGTTGKKRSNNT
jgi:hypothetical protein